MTLHAVKINHRIIRGYARSAFDGHVIPDHSLHHRNRLEPFFRTIYWRTDFLGRNWRICVDSYWLQKMLTRNRHRYWRNRIDQSGIVDRKVFIGLMPAISASRSSSRKRYKSVCSLTMTPHVCAMPLRWCFSVSKLSVLFGSLQGTG